MGVMVSEIILTRIFCVIFWYHFSFLILSTAMLGVGIGGLLIHKYGPRLDSLPQARVMATTALLSGLSLLAALWIITHNPLHPSDPGQSPGTIALYSLFELLITSGILLVPYALMGAALLYTLQKNKDQTEVIYASGLIGSGLGCVAALLFLNIWGGRESLLAVTAIFALTSAGIGWPEEKAVSGMAMGVLLLIILAIPFAGPLFPLKSPLGKPALKFSGNDLAFSEWTGLAKVDIFNDPQQGSDEPYPWGLSPVFRGNYPEKKTILIDSFARTDIIRHNDEPHYYDFLAYLPMYAVYAITPAQPEVLVIGAGGGTDIRAGLELDAGRIDAVEINPSIFKAMTQTFSVYSGGVYQDKRVNAFLGDGRRFIETSGRHYDLIQINNVATVTSTQAGAFLFAENYLYTREAMGKYFDHLTPNGTLCLTQWYLPSNTGYPRFSLRLFCLALTSLSDMGITHPENNILFYESQGFAVLLARKKAFTSGDIQIIATIAGQKQYHMLYRPDKTIFSSMPFYSFVQAIDKQAWLEDYPLQVAPPTDNAPFYFETRKTGSVFRSDKAVSGYSRFDGQTILMVLCCVMTAVFFLLLWVSCRMDRLRKGVWNWLYFACIGMGFMLFEISLSQQMILLLGNPAYALSVILLSMFLFSGLGSAVSGFGRKGVTGNAALIIAAVLLGVQAMFGGSWVHGLMAQNSPVVRVIAAMAISALPAFFMGMAFPFGVHAINQRNSVSLLGLYWAWNGIASVTGAIVAMILAISYGFSTVMATAAVCYGLSSCFLGIMKKA